MKAAEAAKRPARHPVLFVDSPRGGIYNAVCYLRPIAGFHLSSCWTEQPQFIEGATNAGLPVEAECPSNDTVIKVDIVNNVAERTGVSKVKAEEAVEALFEAMKEALRRGERIELRGFGVFVVKPRKRGVGRNPRTGEVTDIPPGKTIRFKPGKELQQ